MFECCSESVSFRRFAQSSPPMEDQKSGPVGLIVASMLGILLWLIFILVYAFYWSGGFSLFQNVVVFIVSLCITGLLIGLMWIVLGPKRYRSWSLRHYSHQVAHSRFKLAQHNPKEYQISSNFVVESF